MSLKIALVTGASSGIGHAAVLALAARGIDSIVTFNRNEEGARRLIAEAARAGAKAVPLRLDIGDSKSFAAFREAVIALLKCEWNAERFDILVNNAGVAQPALFTDTTEEAFDNLSRVLLKGPYFLTQALLPRLADGGAIVNVSSNSALPTVTAPGFSAYASMNGGLTVLTRYMAKEFSARGIRVNAVAPGPTRTRLADNAFEKYPGVIPPLIADTALGRLGEAEDVGAAIAALASDDFRWVTAQTIEVSGGYKL